ncbi:MAG: deoxyribose-phosphate aldolase [Candidatus Solincola sediminis]|uniref:Deoxyribose-phosphate aldolase n=1 Tax=Candidatus Solincola sediminis TaxID=1797199 RepID=A0A1F2WQ19_9ACTN|nr:MAG: deoxyribose-phosphate aldolase [Candidatus Solincola sediminis]OFW58929.1 MAG: deoxyribose-phosphate aldolase [Candidatus Solincola sediminis]
MTDAALEVFPTPGHFTRIIDSTMLKPEASENDYLEFFREVADAKFRCAFVPLYYVAMARLELATSGVIPGAPIGFPFGFVSTDAKKNEAVLALQYGARELDMVMNISALRSRRFDRVSEDIAAVVAMARRFDAGRGEGHVVVKVILETGYLTDEQMRRAAGLAIEAGADAVKTSTGFGPRGASVEDIALLREAVGPGFGVKASGGIRRLADVVAMVKAGASRIGTSSAIEILQEYLGLYNWK